MTRLLLLACLAPWISIASMRNEDRTAGAKRAELEKELRAQHPKTRRAAVKALALEGSVEAWKLVLEALGDPESEVADEAQLALAGVREERALELVLGKAGLAAKEPIVRVRVAEALGRCGVAIEAEALTAELTRRDPELSRYLLWSLERLAERGLLAGDVARAAGRVESAALTGGDPDVRAAAACALHALAPERARGLLGAWSEAREIELRCAAIWIAGRSGELALVRRATFDGACAVRAQAIESLEALGTREAALALAERVASEERERLAQRIVDTLQRLSGLSYRRDPRPWLVWARGLPAEWRAEPGDRTSGPLLSASGAWIETVAQLAGLPLVSDRVWFLIDFSGSMWGERKDGLTVKAVVDRELASAIGALPETVHFNLMPYTNEQHPWQARTVEASAAAKRRALDFFIGCTARGRGNLYGAVLAALADPDVDTLVVWSDGVPTGGVHSNLELVVPLLLEKNRFRKASFDLALVDSPRGSTARLKRLAERTGGRSIELALSNLGRPRADGKGGQESREKR